MAELDRELRAQRRRLQCAKRKKKEKERAPKKLKAEMEVLRKRVEDVEEKVARLVEEAKLWRREDKEKASGALYIGVVCSLVFAVAWAIDCD